MTLNEKLFAVFNEEDPYKIVPTQGNLAYISPRSLFDPLSAEWKEITMEERAALLKKIVGSKASLSNIIYEYKRECREAGREDIVEEVESALVKVLEHMLSEKK